jgi:pyroglutamyl-peptidase
VTRRLLITGFGPFPGMPHNPSGDLAQAVARSGRWQRLGIEARSLVLPTAYSAIDTALKPALRSMAPDALLMIGVAGRARFVRVEACARDRVSPFLSDADGMLPLMPHTADEDGVRWTLARTSVALAILERHGLQARLSIDAGRYLCNASYFASLAETRPTLFIHVPRPGRGLDLRPGARDRRGWHERLEHALAEIGLELLRRSGP